MEAKPDYLEHRKRLRDRFRKSGGDGLLDYELLELLLTYSIRRIDVKPHAKNLIKHFGSLSAVLDASQEEIEEVTKIGPISATLLRVVKEVCAAYLAEKMKNKEILSSPQAVLDFARLKLSGLPHEAFMVIFLNTKNPGHRPQGPHGRNGGPGGNLSSKDRRRSPSPPCRQHYIRPQPSQRRFPAFP